jgi:hypothetical protein
MDVKHCLPIIDGDDKSDAGGPCEVGLSTLSASAAWQRSLEHALCSYAMSGAHYLLPPHILVRDKRHPMSANRSTGPTHCTGSALSVDESGDGYSTY